MAKSNNSKGEMGSNSAANKGRFAVAILAAGKGTRLKSRYPKVLHHVGGKSLLAHVVAAATRLCPAQDVYAIIGYDADRVKEAMAGSGIGFILQKEQRGTGHALMVGKEALSRYDHVIVLSGDAPLISTETIESLRDQHLQAGAAMTLLTAVMEKPYGYGRIIFRNHTREVEAIIEEKSLSPSQRELKEINAGFYAFATKPLFQHISELGTDNKHHEYYLTDMAAILAKTGQKVVAVQAPNAHEVLGCNTRQELAEVDAELRMKKCQQLMDSGVTIYQPQTCVVDCDVTVGPDTVIEPFVHLLGATRIGAECRIRSYSVIINCELGDGVLIRNGCVMDDSRIGAQAVLGPYTHLRPGCQIAEGAHMGNFVEGKKLKLGKGSKAQHLSYLGDAEVGEGVNVGAGTITCNYDGFGKYPTVIGDRSFIGSDANLVAPVKVGKGAYVGAASCITEDIPDDALAIGRGRQVNKEGWARRKREERAGAGKKS
ncbi:MAG TPA: bifunctional UDP-N-acetylglucosamine diphosphorylase/glucosamine-1-phosphate N-acetyltransferase GlmU [Terriglobales bacterium]|nr:bifunctional UDP-N-acetylglucosamine diphosphorylase/glucosamine-1-phosphate N-acetyltransferase GlmU [Terriglobales bacterium]